jgi:hypothetical protein
MISCTSTSPPRSSRTRWAGRDSTSACSSPPSRGRCLLDEILSHYRSPRPALVDAVANLHKERLPSAIPALLEAANAVVDPPIWADEARSYYRQDALMWEVLQRLRRADRWWQRHVRRRRYPFLLPGTIER